jgi:hypothetical protein
MAIYALPFRAADRVISARAEYLSNYLAFLQMKAQAGIATDVIDNDSSGQLGFGALERVIGPRTKLIAITIVALGAGQARPRASPVPVPSSSLSDYFQRHHQVEPRVDGEFFDPAWRRVARIDKLLSDRLISSRE